MENADFSSDLFKSEYSPIPHYWNLERMEMWVSFFINETVTYNEETHFSMNIVGSKVPKKFWLNSCARLFTFLLKWLTNLEARDVLESS